MDDIKDGELEAIYVTGKRRNSVLPSLPTARGAGLAGLETSGGQVVIAPPNMPAELVKRLSNALQNIACMRGRDQARD
jgi:tripartite-type tricarboxylate transporter receptor subunit TctC